MSYLPGTRAIYRNWVEVINIKPQKSILWAKNSLALIKYLNNIPYTLINVPNTLIPNTLTPPPSPVHTGCPQHVLLLLLPTH